MVLCRELGSKRRFDLRELNPASRLTVDNPTPSGPPAAAAWKRYGHGADWVSALPRRLVLYPIELRRCRRRDSNPEPPA
jgi:hypothetical protein